MPLGPIPFDIFRIFVSFGELHLLFILAMLPFIRQQSTQPVSQLIGQAGEHVFEPGIWFCAIKLASTGEGIPHICPLDIKFARTGFFWDLGGGVAFDQYALADSAEMHRLGVWTNIGYQFNDEQAIIGLGRFLQNNNEPFINTDERLDTTSYNSLDVGLKYAYDITETFSLSGEVIYRTLLHNEMDLENAYRFALNLDIEVAPNKMLNFSYGRNFEGAVSREGDYFALLNFTVGLGGKRPVH